MVQKSVIIDLFPYNNDIFPFNIHNIAIFASEKEINVFISFSLVRELYDCDSVFRLTFSTFIMKMLHSPVCD